MCEFIRRVESCSDCPAAEESLVHVHDGLYRLRDVGELQKYADGVLFGRRILHLQSGWVWCVAKSEGGVEVFSHYLVYHDGGELAVLRHLLLDLRLKLHINIVRRDHVLKRCSGEGLVALAQY